MPYAASPLTTEDSHARWARWLGESERNAYSKTLTSGRINARCHDVQKVGALAGINPRQHTAFSRTDRQHNFSSFHRFAFSRQGKPKTLFDEIRQGFVASGSLGFGPV